MGVWLWLCCVDFTREVVISLLVINGTTNPVKTVIQCPDVQQHLLNASLATHLHEGYNVRFQWEELIELEDHFQDGGVVFHSIIERGVYNILSTPLISTMLGEITSTSNTAQQQHNSQHRKWSSSVNQHVSERVSTITGEPSWREDVSTVVAECVSISLVYLMNWWLGVHIKGRLTPRKSDLCVWHAVL